MLDIMFPRNRVFRQGAEHKNHFFSQRFATQNADNLHNHTIALTIHVCQNDDLFFVVLK